MYMLVSCMDVTGNSILFYSRLCPSTAASSPPSEPSNFLSPLLSLSTAGHVCVQSVVMHMCLCVCFLCVCVLVCACVCVRACVHVLCVCVLCVCVRTHMCIFNLLFCMCFSHSLADRLSRGQEVSSLVSFTGMDGSTLIFNTINSYCVVILSFVLLMQHTLGIGAHTDFSIHI